MKIIEPKEKQIVRSIMGTGHTDFVRATVKFIAARIELGHPYTFPELHLLAEFRRVLWRTRYEKDKLQEELDEILRDTPYAVEDPLDDV